MKTFGADTLGYSRSTSRLISSSTSSSLSEVSESESLYECSESELSIWGTPWAPIHEKKRFHYTLQQQHRSTWAKLKMRNQHYNAAHNHMCRTQWMTAKNMCRTKNPPLLCIDDTPEDKYITHKNVLHIYAVHKRRCSTGLQMNTRCSKNPTNTYLLRPCY